MADRERLAQVAQQVRVKHPEVEAKIRSYEKNLPTWDDIFHVDAEFIRERGWNRLQRKDHEYGSALPWASMKVAFRLRPSETTIWAGPNKSLKSATVNFILARLAWEGEKVFIASFELTVDDQVARLARQFTCDRSPDRRRFDNVIERLGPNLLLRDFVGRATPERVVAMARYAATDLECRHVLIDNMTMVVPPSRDSDERAASFIAGLYQVGRDTGAHMHVVAHMRKPEHMGQKLSRYDIRGTGAAPDMVDNVVILQRDERPDKDREGGPELWFRVDAQRHGAFRGSMPFWVDDASLRLIERESGTLFPPESFA